MILLHVRNTEWIHILCHFHLFGDELLHTTLPVQINETRARKFQVVSTKIWIHGEITIQKIPIIEYIVYSTHAHAHTCRDIQMPTQGRSCISAASMSSSVVSQGTVSIWRGTSTYARCSMMLKTFWLMTLSSISNWSNERRLTKAELLHWKSCQYVKLLWPPSREELPQLPGCTLSTVTHTWRWTKLWGNILDEMNTSCIRYRTLLSAINASSNLWYTTWGAIWGLLCMTTTVASRIRKR